VGAPRPRERVGIFNYSIFDWPKPTANKSEKFNEIESLTATRTIQAADVKIHDRWTQNLEEARAFQSQSLKKPAPR
jgi:hypothetical protein